MKHADIIKQMTLEEKCYLFSGKDFWQSRSIERLGVPNMTLSDGPHGVRKQEGAGDQLGLNGSLPATCYPTAATIANSWDPSLGEEIGGYLGAEAASQGVCVLLGPGLNIKRSPFCGRNFEYFSEDPYLAGKMAAGYVRGIQKNGVSACPKHFAANSQELRRMASDSVMDERTLREIYLTGFEIAVKEGKAKSIMASTAGPGKSAISAWNPARRSAASAAGTGVWSNTAPPRDCCGKRKRRWRRIWTPFLP